MTYLFFITILFVSELVYFKLADKYNIIDKPNGRSSHSVITIRGGGIIFPISIMLWFFCFDKHYPLFVCGLLLISFISFLDDIKDFSKRIRLTVHLTAMGLVFLQLQLFNLNWIIILAIIVFFIGVINAYNFMDGINGITGIYSIVALLTLLWINIYQIYFIDTSLLIMTIIGLIVFNFFNVRTNAKCFAGDVGSISMAFIICFLLIKLIIQSTDLRYLLLLVIYGIDAVFTILIRLRRGQNIFLAHRLHLYQLLVNECGQKHLLVAVTFGSIQALVNVLIIITISQNIYVVMALTILPLVMIYLWLRLKISRRKLYKTGDV